MKAADTSKSKNLAMEILKSYRAGEENLYIVGSFDSGVTVVSQQVRALNLAWALVESGVVPTLPFRTTTTPPQIAVVGGGFAGVTVAAGLMRKGCTAGITLFERCDTLLPLQQGSDSRWLHPKIYDWPNFDSEASSAYLPVLNWTAARASDVVVEFLKEWASEVRKFEEQIPNNLAVYCNTRHLQVLSKNNSTLRIEWVGEPRKPSEAIHALNSGGKSFGQLKDFDIVILAVGFGLESIEPHSYWRNETLSQPSLQAPQKNFIVSGQGDGAIIDLLRLRISQFRQDRILSELFAGKSELVDRLRVLAEISDSSGMFSQLESIFVAVEKNKDADILLDTLRKRLRNDTQVTLHIKEKRFSDLFSSKRVKMSFQNKLMVYLLYRCGGFSPSSDKLHLLQKQYGVSKENTISRHGPIKVPLFREMLSRELFDKIFREEKDSDGVKRWQAPATLTQSAVGAWSGGYFGRFGTTPQTKIQTDVTLRQRWGKEYLPSTTRLMATAFCSSLSGWLAVKHPNDQRLRVTLHRSMKIGLDNVLQQTCDYVGVGLSSSETDTAARVFPAENGTIGLAWRTGSVVRTIKKVPIKTLQQSMDKLNLNDISRDMSADVNFVLAIPLISEVKNEGYVVGVIYIDSVADDFYIPDKDLIILAGMAQSFLASIFDLSNDPFSKIVNRQLSLTKLARTINDFQVEGLQILKKFAPPRITSASSQSVLNVELSDFVPVLKNV
jgi:hypothetical protein